MSKIILTSGAAPSTPTSGTVALYSDANDTLRFKDDTGTDVGIVTVSVGGITTLDKLQFEDHGSNAQMWLIEEDSNNPTNALVFDYSGTERLRIVPSGDIADSSNNVVLSFSSTNEDGVNWIDVKNTPTGSGPIISSVGADTNIDLNISAKGTGIVNLGSGGVKLNAPLDVNNQAFTNVGPFSFGNGVVLSFASGGEAGANWVDVVWAEAGSGPVIRSVGADTNVDLVLDTKGTGDIDASSNKIINVGNPVGLQDAATKAYADNNFSTITRTVNAQTGTTYTLVLGDAGDVVTMDNVSTNTLTIPTNASVAFAIGDQIEVIMKGAGVTTVTGDTGVTVNGVSAGGATIDAQYKTVTILKVATDTWIMFGAHGTVA